jgi:hypothetical protein
LKLEGADLLLEQELLPGMPPELLGAHYQQSLNTETRQHGGSFFTPPALALRVVEQTLSPLLTHPDSLPTVLDPACGAGWFLFAAWRFLYDWLLRWYQQKQPEVLEPAGGLPPLLRKRLLQKLYGIDQDAVAIKLCRLGLCQLARLPRHEPQLLVGDSFKNSWFTTTAIVGNPPYIRVQKQQERVGADTYLAFVEKTLDALESGTRRAGLVVPNRILSARYAAPLRRRIARLQLLESVEDMGGEQHFAGASTYICVLGLCSEPPISVRITRNHESSWLSPKALVEDPWPLRTGQGAPLETRLSKFQTLENVANLFVGVQTSADKIFHLPYSTLLEHRLLKPLVSGAGIRPWAAPYSHAAILFPYRLEGEKALLYSEEELEGMAPYAWSYLKRHRESLEAREGGRFKGEGWYRFGRSQNLGIQEGPKGIVPRLVKNLGASLDMGGMVLDNADVVGVRAKGAIPLVGLIGLLNSRVWSWYLRRISPPFRGGYVTANRQYLGRMPVPELGEAGVLELCRLAESRDQSGLDAFVEDALGVSEGERAASLG